MSPTAPQPATMNKTMNLASSLNSVLLSTDEEEYDKIATEVAHQLGKATDLANQSLDNLDPSYQTLPFLYILNAQIDSSLSSGKAAARQVPATVLPEGRLWSHIANLFLTFDPIQVRYAGQPFTRLVDIVARGAEQSGNAIPAIQLLHNAILRLDPTSSTLTTTHYHYIRLCLLARACADATLILDLPIYTIPSAEASKQVGNRAYRYLCSVHDSSATYLTPSTGLTQKVTSRLYMEYFLMGAMCYIAVEDYQKALLYLEVVIVAPTIQTSTSAVQLEAYKKWLLVNLIISGRPAEMPKALTANVSRNLRTIAKPYQYIVDAFKSDDMQRFTAEIHEGMDIWPSDGNWGLVREVYAAFRKFKISRLERTYETVSLEDVAHVLSKESTDVQGAQEYVKGLIESGEIQAQLVPSPNGGAGTLRFLNQQSSSEGQVEQHLALRSQSLQQLLQHISEIDHQMEIGKDYIEWLQKLRASRDRDKKGTATANRSLVVDVHDEDMMDDL